MSEQVEHYVTESLVEVCEQLGLTYRQLDFWVRQGYVRTVMVNQQGVYVSEGHQGYVRRIEPGERRALELMARLVRVGFVVHKAAQISRALLAKQLAATYIGEGFLIIEDRSVIEGERPVPLDLEDV